MLGNVPHEMQHSGHPSDVNRGNRRKDDRSLYLDRMKRVITEVDVLSLRCRSGNRRDRG